LLRRGDLEKTVYIDIEDLSQETIQVQHEYESGELALEYEDASLSRPVNTAFNLSHQDRKLHVDGVVEAGIRYKCSRCLKEFERPLVANFAVVYLPQPTGMKVDEEIALKYEEMDIGFYDGIRLDVDQMVLEQIELSMEMRFICQEECKGLCWRCGADLNEGLCSCKEEKADSRLAVLLEFKKKMRN